jgi:hypothetical protein
MKTYWGVEEQLHDFLTSALDGSEWSASRLGRFTPSVRDLDTLLIGGWVGTRAGLEAGRENIFPITDSTGN